MFLGCLSFTEFPLNIQGTWLFIFAVQYISISLYTFTRYIYISVASRPELRILKLRFNILCSLRINLNTVILILHSACMPTYFLLHTFAGVERFARSQILYYLLYFMYAFFYEYSNTFNSTPFVYIYVLLLYICIQYASRLFYYLLICYILLCFSISTVI